MSNESLTPILRLVFQGWKVYFFRQMKKIKILLDTDIGSDIDDSVCLAYLLSQPKCDLLGITTVTGDTVKRAMLASVLCRLAGREIPIFPGSRDPLIIPQKQPLVPQSAALGKWKHDTKFPLGQAIDFMRRTIRKHPGEITLLAIGPMTNIALLFCVDPEIPHLLKALVMMIGVFNRKDRTLPLAEWNSLVDPHASAIVFNAPVRTHRSIGLDVTTKVVMNTDEVTQRFQTRLLRPVLDFARVWFRERNTITFHDPLAAVTIFNPNICGFAQGKVTVDLHEGKYSGKTLWTPGTKPGPHAIALSVDSDRFFSHYFSVCGQAGE